MQGSNILLYLTAFLAPALLLAAGCLVFQRAKLREALESEKKYRDIYETAPDGYFSMDRNGIIVNVNSTWLKMLGYQKDEILKKKNFRDFLTEGWQGIFEDTYLGFREKNYLKDIEFYLKKKDGGILPVLIDFKAVYDEKGTFVKSRSVVRDNSVKKSYENMLKRASDEWRATFDSMPYGVMLLDRDFNIIKLNEYMANISGHPVKELVGRKCYEKFHGGHGTADKCPLEKSLKTQNAESLEYHDGNTGKYFLVNVTPIFEENAPVAYIHSLIDITEIKGKEKKLDESKKAFFNMLKDASEAFNELKGLHHNLILAFANAIDAKSPWTKGHSERVAYYSIAIGLEMGLTDKELDTLKTAALLHDIGKIGTNDYILDKPARLTDEEFAAIKMHPIKGEEILKPIKELDHILPAIRAHHERMDGSGYPDRLQGEEIPLLARILCVADSFDSMTADRPYRSSPGKDYAVSELYKCKGSQFDPRAVDAFLRAMDKGMKCGADDIHCVHNYLRAV